MIKKMCLHVIRNGTEYKYHLHTNKLTTPSIGVYYNQNLYCPLRSGTSYLNVQYNNSNYYAVDITPVAAVTFTLNVDTTLYAANPYEYESFKIQMKDSCVINNDILFQVQTASNTWTTKATLSAAETSVTSNDFRVPAPGNNWRLKIGDWTSSSYTATIGSNSINVAIPEAQWGA